MPPLSRLTKRHGLRTEAPFRHTNGMSCDSKKYELRYVGRSPTSPMIDIKLGSYPLMRGIRPRLLVVNNPIYIII
jgi:hypothetical protein